MPAFAPPQKRFNEISKRLKQDVRPPGNFSFGTQLLGGPSWTDAFKSARAPSLTQLVENYSALIYAMVARNRNAVARLPMRLLADGSRVQGKPSRACDPIKVSREVGVKLAEAGQISSAAIDQVYEIRNHPLLDVLDSPDPYGTFASREQFIGTIVSFFDVVGATYIVPEGNGWDWRGKQGRSKGPPEYLWLIYPQYTIPIRKASNPIVDYFQYFQDQLPLEAVLWIRHNHSLRDVYGSFFSPTYAGESYRKQEQQLITILSQLLQSPRPNLLISSKDPMQPMGPAEADALEIDMLRKQSHAGAGGLMVIKDAVDVTPTSYQPIDLAGKEVAMQDMYTLACIFDQPPTFYTVDSNLANLEAAKAMHWDQGVEPRCKTVAGCFTRLAKQFDPRLMFKFDHGLVEDEESKQKVVDMRLKSGQTTINQENEESKIPPQPWGDEPLLPDNILPLSKIIEAHQSTMDQNKQAMEQGDQSLASGEQADVLAADQHEHQKKMDKEGLKIDAKKAAQKPAAKRALTEEEVLAEASELIRTIKGELERRAS